MSTPSRKAFSFIELLHLWVHVQASTRAKNRKGSGRVSLDWAAEKDPYAGLGRIAGRPCLRHRRELWRCALQIAAEREIAVRVLVELRDRLEAPAPAWYVTVQHERVESALELLQRL